MSTITVWITHFPIESSKIGDLNITIASKEILPTQKSSEPDSATVEFYQTFKEETPIHLKLLQKTGGNVFKLILWGQNQPDIQARQRYYKKTTDQYLL